MFGFLSGWLCKSGILASYPSCICVFLLASQIVSLIWASADLSLFWAWWFKCWQCWFSEVKLAIGISKFHFPSWVLWLLWCCSDALMIHSESDSWCHQELESGTLNLGIFHSHFFFPSILQPTPIWESRYSCFPLVHQQPALSWLRRRARSRRTFASGARGRLRQLPTHWWRTRGLVTFWNVDVRMAETAARALSLSRTMTSTRSTQLLGLWISWVKVPTRMTTTLPWKSTAKAFVMERSALAVEVRSSYNILGLGLWLQTAGKNS